MQRGQEHNSDGGAQPLLVGAEKQSQERLRLSVPCHTCIKINHWEPTLPVLIGSSFPKILLFN